jgi:hypothetical protein
MHSRGGVAVLVWSPARGPGRCKPLSEQLHGPRGLSVSDADDLRDQLCSNWVCWFFKTSEATSMCHGPKHEQFSSPVDFFLNSALSVDTFFVFFWTVIPTFHPASWLTRRRQGGWCLAAGEEGSKGNREARSSQGWEATGLCGRLTRSTLNATWSLVRYRPDPIKQYYRKQVTPKLYSDLRLTHWSTASRVCLHYECDKLMMPYFSERRVSSEWWVLAVYIYQLFESLNQQIDWMSKIHGAHRGTG